MSDSRVPKENSVFRTYPVGKHIDNFLGKSDCRNGSFPEDRTASVVKAFNPGMENIVKGIGRVLNGNPVKNLANGEMKCLVKLLDAAERLVIQVHPTVEFAKKYFNTSYGKTECWFFLDCDADAHVYVGFKENVTYELWKNAFKTQNIEMMRDMLLNQRRIIIKKLTGFTQ